MEWNQTLAFAIVIMLSYFIEGMIGFGGTIIALPVEGLIVGLKTAVPVLTIVVFCASVIIALRDFRYIVKKEYLKIALIMAVGLLPGMWLFASIPERPLKLLLGIFMIGVGIKGLKENLYDKRLIRLGRKADEPKKLMPKWLGNLLLICGGIIHGAFASGGPFVVVYATEAIKGKSHFRATLCALWATLNAIMIVMYSLGSEITGPVLNLSLWSLPFVAVAIVVSNMVHKRVNGETFTVFVYFALLIAGVVMAL